MVGLQERLTGTKTVGRNCVVLLFFPLAILWMEAIVRLWNFQTFWSRGLLYTVLFSCAYGLCFSIFCVIWPQGQNRFMSLLLSGVLTLLYLVQAVYYTVMRTVPVVYSVTVMSDATEFWQVGLRGALRTLPAILLLLLPFFLLLLFGKHHTPDRLFDGKQVLGGLLLAVMLYAAALGSVFFTKSGILNPWTLYMEEGNPELNVANFGVLTSLRLDAKRYLFSDGNGNKTRLEESVKSAAPADSAGENEYAPNSMDIDFSALSEAERDETLKSLHEYFAGREPTLQNEHTGRFAGKNLIMITAEAFNSWAIDPERTPTLYRLSQEGFVCDNFYTPLWWVSTSDGEYVTCTSLLPKSGEQSFAAAMNNSLYFSLGNQFRAQSYDTFAYHNHSYTYYQRDRTHTNMGYDFKAVGNGLEISPLWPESDLEMVEASVPDYLDGENPFHVYYMTVSGHLEYYFDENAMAQKHRALVEDLPLSEEAQAYLACQTELELALSALLAQLEAAGELENTVICLYGDHYPYGLPESAIEELGGPDLQGTAELYRSTMILWSADMEEAVHIEKPCSNLDILPTLLNLFGLEYDSRLLMGRDILSTAPGLVIFSDYSYITDSGSYSAKEDVFTGNRGCRQPENYPQTMLQAVQDAFYYSALLLQTDYYAQIGLKAD